MLGFWGAVGLGGWNQGDVFLDLLEDYLPRDTLAKQPGRCDTVRLSQVPRSGSRNGSERNKIIESHSGMGSRQGFPERDQGNKQTRPRRIQPLKGC